MTKSIKMMLFCLAGRKMDERFFFTETNFKLKPLITYNSFMFALKIVLHSNT